MEYRITATWLIHVSCITGFLLLLTASGILCLVNNVMDDSQNRERLTSTRYVLCISASHGMDLVGRSYSEAAKLGRVCFSDVWSYYEQHRELVGRPIVKIQ